MLGKKIEIYMPQIIKTGYKLSTLIGENVEIYMSHIAKIGHKLSTMVGENFKIYTCLKHPKLVTNCQPSLEKHLKFTCLK